MGTARRAGPGLLDVQRDVVKNERRQSFDNRPYGPSYLATARGAVSGRSPLHGAIIGSMADLSAATLDGREGFFPRLLHAQQRPCHRGRFETEKVKASIQKYFGSLVDRAKKPTPQPPLPPPRFGRYVVEEPVELAEVTFGYRTPPAYNADDPIVDVAMALLAGGKATRLYQSLVVEKKLASEVSASQDSNQLSGIVTIGATAATGKTVPELESALTAALANPKRQVPPLELERAKRGILLSTLKSLELLTGPGGESGRAGLLQRFAHYTGDPGYLPKWVEQIEKVTAAECSACCRAPNVAQARCRGDAAQTKRAEAPGAEQEQKP